MAAAVVDVGAVALKPAAGQAQSDLRGLPLEQQSGFIVEKGTVGPNGIKESGPVAVVVDRSLVLGKLTA